MSKNIVTEYFFYYDKYVKIYGKVAIFMQVGSFYELYETDDKSCELTKIAEITNLAKAKRKEQYQSSPLYMMGFTTPALDKFLKMLIDEYYTVVVIEQLTPPPAVKRGITGIYSPGTYITGNNTYESSKIVSLYFEDEKKLGIDDYLTCVGMSSVDLSTGEVLVYEVCSTTQDNKYALDETYRFVLSQKPRELIIYRKELEGKSISKDSLLSYLELDDQNVHYSTNINKTFLKINYQNEFFGKIYKDHHMNTPIEYIEMEMMSYSRVSLVVLYDFVHKHNETFINNLYKPEIFRNNKHLILGNNAIYQLGILENNTLESNRKSKIKSLFDVINHTSTSMGKRLLKNTICEPLNDIDEINSRYNCIEEQLQNNLYIELENHLGGVLDIQRLSRKICLSIMHPYELANLITSLTNIIPIYNLIKNTKHNNKYNISEESFKTLELFLTGCKKTFDIEKLKEQNLNDMSETVFNSKIYPQIDELQDKLANNIQSMEEICNVLETYINDTNKFAKETGKITLQKNNKDGYYLKLSKRRANIFKNNIKDLEIIKINDNLSINPKHLEYDEKNKNDTKIFFKDFNNKSTDTITLKEKLIDLVTKKYKDLMSGYGQKYKEMFKDINKCIAMIDFLKSCAKTAKMYNYCKPQIVPQENKGYIDAKKMRHPIIERIRTDIEYIPHDIKLGIDEMDGIILFGLNSAGKSSLMKSIGLNLIMAQCGMFVSSESFKYSLYDSVLARISGNDNIFKNQSSFQVEMTELDSILKRAGSKTLVIGDEICRGTEHDSAVAIVAATIIRLSQSKSSFIFATHLHEIPNIKKIKKLTNIKICHLSVDYDDKTDNLIFNRELQPGPGSSDYGLTVAKYIIKDKEFISLAQKIKNKFKGIIDKILPTKTSKYNSDLYIDKCQICGKQNNELDDKIGKLDTHHILNQKDCKEGFSLEKTHIQKDAKSNLVVLCKLCHHKVHHGQMEITGYNDTAKGRIINYKLINSKSKLN